MQDSLLSRTMEKTYQKPATSWLLKTKYIILFLVISGALGCISLLSIQTGLHLGWMKLLQMICFCAAGILHVKKMHGFNFTKSDDRSKLQFSIQLFALIFLLLLVGYYLIYPDFILMALGSACAFILPFLIAHSWITLAAFSGIEYKIWTVPVPDTSEKTFIFFGGVPTRIIFSLEGNDRNKKLVKSNAPLEKSVGDFYNHFLLIQRNNNRQNIALKDENERPFGWKFFKVDMWGLIKKQLDPEATFEELHLKNHSTILAKRVRLAEEDNL